MSTDPHALNRRHFLTLGAAAGAGVLASSALTEAGAAGVVQAAAPAPIKPMPLPAKVYTTETAGISRKTHDEHHKLYTGYVNKVNEIRTKMAALGVPDPTKANGTFSELRELKVEYSFALNGVKNHELYFGNLGGKGGAPNGAIGEAIGKTFGSYDSWKADLKATGIAARGWVWLAYDFADDSIFNYIGDAQNTFPIWNAMPLLGLDVYEHAYYFDFQTARAKYIDAFLSVIDWDAVNHNFSLAQGMAKGGK